MRVVTLNIWQEQGQWQRRMAAIERQLRLLDPDVVCLQEVREVPGRVPNQAQTLASALGMDHRFVAAQPWDGGDEGVAVLSRGSFRSHDSVELPWEGSSTRRVCLGAELEFEASQLLWVFTTHLAYLPADGGLREQQVLALDRFVRTKAQGGTTVVTGDFNAVPEADEIRFMRGLTALEGQRSYYQDAFACCNPGDPGWTWCSDNPYTEPLSWLPRDRRLDYIFVSAHRRAGSARIRECRIVCQHPEPDGTRCSDHYGLLAELDP